MFRARAVERLCRGAYKASIESGTDVEAHRETARKFRTHVAASPYSLARPFKPRYSHTCFIHCSSEKRVSGLYSGDVAGR